LLTENLGILVSVVGSVAGGLYCFTLPPMFWYHLHEKAGEPLALSEKLVLIVEILSGVAIIVAGVVVCFQSAEGVGPTA
jgi:hypothetical protein